MISVWFSGSAVTRLAQGTAILLSIIFLSACGMQSKQQNYAYTILNRPVPHDESERIVECGWLGGEKARQTNLGDNGSGVYSAGRTAAYYRIVTNDNIGIIQTRMNYLQCDKSPTMKNASLVVN
jgi:hypothetical protein